MGSLHEKNLLFTCRLAWNLLKYYDKSEMDMACGNSSVEVFYLITKKINNMYSNKRKDKSEWIKK
jgi:hypothetical protein